MKSKLIEICKNNRLAFIRDSVSIDEGYDNYNEIIVKIIEDEITTIEQLKELGMEV